MSNQTSCSHRKPIVVIDAGIATDGNIAMLKNKGYDYMCVSLELAGCNYQRCCQVFA